MRRLLWCVFLFACGKSGDSASSRCTRAFDQLVASGTFGGQTYAGQVAIAFGVACADLTPDDFQCIADLKTQGGNKCEHANAVLIDVNRKLTAGRRTEASAQRGPSGVDALVASVCDCTTSSCLVTVGETHRALLNQLMTSPPAADATRKIGACLQKLPSFPKVGGAAPARVTTETGASLTSKTKFLVRRLANEGFPSWSMKNPSRACPSDIADLHDAIGTPTSDRHDPWGQPLIMVCGGAERGVSISSAGPDRQKGTADDIMSATRRDETLDLKDGATAKNLDRAKRGIEAATKMTEAAAGSGSAVPKRTAGPTTSQDDPIQVGDDDPGGETGGVGEGMTKPSRIR